jgi:acyl-coenzyme A synthetase/AMP-(fatty) acid ligase
MTSAIAAADECGIPHSNIFVFDSQEGHVPEGYQSWRKLLSHGEASWIAVEDPSNTTAVYFSTSGTSGLPKAAVVSHSYLTTQGEIQAETVSGSDKVSRLKPGLTTHQGAYSFQVSCLIALPPFHAYVFQIQHALPLRKGIPIYVMPRYEPKNFLSAIEKFQITRIPIVPPILVSMSKSSLCNRSTLKSLRRIYVAGSITKKEMQQQVYKLISPTARIENLYGMTESGWTASTWRNRKRDQTGSIGTPFPGMELR